MNWKTPISSGIYESFGDDDLARDLFLHLLLKTRNSDMSEPDFYCGKPYRLKRGQVIFGKKAYSKKLRCSAGASLNALHRLSKRQDEHQIILEPSNDYTVVTLISYDKLIKMNSDVSTNIDSESPPLKRAEDTNKSVKNEKNNKVDNNESQGKKVSLKSKLTGELKPLDYEYIYDIAKRLFLNIEDVRLIERQVILSVKDGNPYHLTNQANAVERWCYNALGNKKIEVRNDTEDMLFKFASPEEIAKSKRNDELLKIKFPNLY